MGTSLSPCMEDDDCDADGGTLMDTQVGVEFDKVRETT